MFSKISRYRKLPDVVAPDARGRALASKSLRLLPETAGDFLHTVEEGDRLDTLAYKYYKQPRDWWRIADANAAFLDPQALLDEAPWKTVQIPLIWNGPTPPWAEVPQALTAVLGVAAVRLGTPEQAVPGVDYPESPVAFSTSEAAVVNALQELVAYGASGGTEGTLLTAEALSTLLYAVLTDEGYTPEPGTRLLFVENGQWRLVEPTTGQVYTFVLATDGTLLNVHLSLVHYAWTVTVTFNTLLLADVDLLPLVEALGFGTAPPAEVRRIGKPVVIPPRSTRS